MELSLIPSPERNRLPAVTWFAKAIERFNAQGRFKTQKELAEFLGTYPSKLNKWLSGSMPPPEEQERLLERMGGDISRALPGWVPVAGELAGRASPGMDAQAIPIAGKVVDGFIPSPEDLDLSNSTNYLAISSNAVGEAWSEKIKATQGQLYAVLVSDNSLKNEFDPGSWLILSRRVFLDKFKSGWLAAVNESGKPGTLLLSRCWKQEDFNSKTEFLVGIPSCSFFPPVAWKQSSAFIDSLVVACIKDPDGLG